MDHIDKLIGEAHYNVMMEHEKMFDALCMRPHPKGKISDLDGVIIDHLFPSIDAPTKKLITEYITAIRDALRDHNFEFLGLQKILSSKEMPDFSSVEKRYVETRTALETRGENLTRNEYQLAERYAEGSVGRIGL